MNCRFSLFVLVAFLVSSSPAIAVNTVSKAVTGFGDDGTYCVAVNDVELTGSAARLGGTVVYKDNVPLREVGIRNNLGELPVQMHLTSDCDVIAIYPEYDNGDERFQNVYRNGEHLKDLPVREE